MKLSLLSFSALAATALAVPTPTSDELVAPAHIAKRATLGDVAHGYASMNGGTKGGKGGTTTTVSTYAQFTAAVAGDAPKVVVVATGTITNTTSLQVNVGSNTTIVGKSVNGTILNGFGLLVRNETNVIIRNLVIKKVLAAYGDAIGVQYSTNVWIDHCDLSSDRTHNKDYYDGLLDLTHRADFITVSNTYFHDHWKASLIGHSDNNGAEDIGHLRVTYNNNYFQDIFSRGPSVRFGVGHFYNSIYMNVQNAIDTRLGAQLLVQSNVWAGYVSKALFSQDDGYAVAIDNIWGGQSNEALPGNMTTASIPYAYTLLGSANTWAAVCGVAGATLTF